MFSHCTHPVYLIICMVGLSVFHGRASSFAASEVGPQTEVISATGMEMVWISPGVFSMGSPSAEPGRDDDEQQHKVTLSKGFWLGKTEVTQLQWFEVMGSNPSRLKGDNLPVEMVSWLECVDFCNLLSEREGLTPAYRISDQTVFWNETANGYRLPTEAQWEYSCRAGTITAHAGDLDAMANYSLNSGRKTRTVGGRKANAWGLYDMHGNVWEWCWDFWIKEYGSGHVTDPVGANEGSHKVIRGGSWHRNFRDCRSASRGTDTSNTRRSGLGLRLSRWGK